VEARIDAVQKAKFTATEKAQALLVIFPSLDRQSQRKVAHALVKFVDDSSYGLIRRQLMDTKLHPQVLSVFMTDTLKRQNRIKIPVLLALARVETHPLKSEARELLAAYVRQDHGTNWAQWDSTVNAWLMQNPG
jgi:hypothetical protein